MKVDMMMPKLGESIAEATVLKWLKAQGDSIEKDEVILEISTDKVDSEIPTPSKGFLSKILVAEGETVEVGTIVAEIVTDEAELSAEEQGADDTVEFEAPPDVEKKREKTAGSPESSTTDDGRFYSPLVRSIAKKEGITQEELASIDGSGHKGRVTKSDVLAYIKLREAAPAETKSPVSPEDDERTKVVPMDHMRKLIADHMLHSVRTSPHVYSMTEVDMNAVSDFRNKVKAGFKKQEGFNLTYTPFIIRAAARALKEFPYVNASIEGENVVLKKYVNIGIAVALENGLIVPVVRDADELDLRKTARAAHDLASRARSKKLLPDEVHDGTFSITNMGVFGNMAGFPIINQPQVAILGIGTVRKRPVVIDDTVEIRPVLYLTLGFDHRLIDGAYGGKFLERIADILTNFDPKVGI